MTPNREFYIAMCLALMIMGGAYVLVWMVWHGL